MPRAAEGSARTIAIPDPGEYVARNFWIIDMGTQTKKSVRYGDKQQRTILWGWELSETSHVFDEAKGPQPFMISQETTFSTYEQANMRKLLEDWREKPLSADEVADKEATPLINKFLGKPCMITVKHNKADNGKTYANMAAIRKLPATRKVADGKGGLVDQPLVRPKSINQDILFDLDDPGCVNVFPLLPKWVQKKVEASPEWQAIQSGGTAAPAKAGNANTEDEF